MLLPGKPFPMGLLLLFSPLDWRDGSQRRTEKLLTFPNCWGQVQGIILANVLLLRGFGMNNSDFVEQ